MREGKGLLAIAGGVIVLWAVVTGRARAVAEALGMVAPGGGRSEPSGLSDAITGAGSGGGTPAGAPNDPRLSGERRWSALRTDGDALGVFDPTRQSGVDLVTDPADSRAGSETFDFDLPRYIANQPTSMYGHGY